MLFSNFSRDVLNSGQDFAMVSRTCFIVSCFIVDQSGLYGMNAASPFAIFPFFDSRIILAVKSCLLAHSALLCCIGKHAHQLVISDQNADSILDWVEVLSGSV